MAKRINRLSATEVSKKIEPGMYADGDGLYLQISKWQTKAWILRYQLAGTPRWMGLGSVRDFSLKEARERARKFRQQLADGIDPIEQRKETKAAIRADDAKRVKFKEACQRYIKAHQSGWKNPKHAAQWPATLETYAWPVMGDMPIAKVDVSHVMQILEPIWTQKTETASRLRGRIESVLDWATARKFRSGDNPARWRGHLDKLLPLRSKVAKVRHHPALPYAELPGFMERLRRMNSISARALEFTILTAARTSEAIGAREGEINFAEKLWTVPAERMKAGKEHRVPLPDRAVEIIATRPREEGSDWIFPGGRKGRPLSNMAMLELLRDIAPGLTVHGFRSTFRDWAAERTNYASDIAEAALAHTLRDKTRESYERGDKLDKRRRLMRDWAKYCAEKPSAKDNVVPMMEKA